jgi:tripartite-type tricarboxylate transporter receptor subunit TctC
MENVMKALTLLLFSALGLGSATAGEVQSWPTRPVRAIVPVSPGGATDIIPRVVFEQLAQQLGQPIVVENRPGAGTTTGANAVAKSEPDGYTLLVNGPSHAIAPALYPELGYDAARDFAAAAPFGITPSVLVVPPGRGFKAPADLVAAAKAKPGAMNFSSVGAGTGTHLSAERFLASVGVKAVHVPFKGGAEAMTEVIAGRIDFFFGPLALVLPHIRDGKLTALAVNGARRAAALPDVPTLAESGIANAEYPFWLGLFVPAKTPRAIVDKLHGETLKALQAPKVHDKFTALGFDPMVMAPAEFDRYVANEIALNAALVKAIGLRTH